MTTDTVPASELRGHLEAIGHDLSNGQTAGYLDCGTVFNLNAIAIGVGLEDVSYEPEKFPGLVYNLDEPELTVVIFSGILATVDAADTAAVESAFTQVMDSIQDLGLAEASVSEEDIAVPADEIPVPARDWEETMSSEPTTDSGSESEHPECSACGTRLDGDESYCPECGEQVSTECESCGATLEGTENYCPECGTELSGGVDG